MPSSAPLNKATLQANAVVRLEDAWVLFDNDRFDGAAYLGGYAVEFALKARICETLNSATYPDRIHGFKTHQLEVLLFLTGREGHIKSNALPEWTFVLQSWRPEMRYEAMGTISSANARALLDAAGILLNLL